MDLRTWRGVVSGGCGVDGWWLWGGRLDVDCVDVLELCG